MFPKLFHIPVLDSDLHTYGVLVALAFLVALWLVGRLAKENGLKPDDVTNLGLYCALSAIAGAKVMMFLVDARYYAGHPREILSMESLQAGGVFYGGLIAALAVSWWYMRKTHLPLFQTADIFAPAIALGHGIGRIGCFAAGCCWGGQCDRPWAVTFTSEEAHNRVGVPLGVPLHPTQLYEAIGEFVIFGILYWKIRKAHAPGAIISLYLMLYSSLRFVVEFFRYHEQGNLFNGPLDTSQWISIVLFGMGAAYFLRQRVRKPAAAV
jgi:phosphatidylglycerol:prolipoprotein diacylglycerol transferase